MDLQSAIDGQGQLIKRLAAVIEAQARINPLGSPIPSPAPSSFAKHLYPNGKAILWDAPSESGSDLEKDVTSPNSRARKKGKERMHSMNGAAS